MRQLKTIDPDMAVTLQDRLYFTVRMNLVDRKSHDNFAKDQRARDVTAKLVAKLDGFYIGKPLARDPKHDDTHFRTPIEDNVADCAERATSGKIHLLPVMNARPAAMKGATDV